jgi:hypothetical protein
VDSVVIIPILTGSIAWTGAAASTITATNRSKNRFPIVSLLFLRTPPHPGAAVNLHSYWLMFTNSTNRKSPLSTTAKKNKTSVKYLKIRLQLAVDFHSLCPAPSIADADG